MKHTKKTILLAGFMISVLSVLIIACQKNAISVNDSSQPRNVAIYLTDDPCQYDSVFIDLKYLELKIDTSQKGRNSNGPGWNDDDHDNGRNDHGEDHKHFDKNGVWDTLNIKPGLYNILSLRNGNDVVFGTGTIFAGTITKMRITVGPNSYVVASGVKHSLNLFHSNDNYTYIHVHGGNEDRTYKPGQTTMWLDFNICKSIKSFNHHYYLTPFFRVFAMSTTGTLEGDVFPRSAQPYVTIWNNSDTASAMPEGNGHFKVRGLTAGTYSVAYQGFFGFKDTTLLHIQVKAGQETKLPGITLHQ
jgi:hypothetical protein